MTNATITKQDVIDAINKADDTLYKNLYDYDELPMGTPVYRLGCDGYVKSEVWDKVFAALPDWAMDAYTILGNGAKPIEEVVEHINNGDLSEWWERELNDAADNDPDLWDRMLGEVYYTEIGD